MKKTVIFFFAALVIVSIIIFSWFYEGKIIANGSEENFSIFHSQKNAEYALSFWRSVGIGYKVSFLRATYPAFTILGFLERMEMPAFARQALLLATLMLVGIFSTYLLIKKAFNLGYVEASAGAIFYFLNLYSLTQVWKRFIYSHMFAWAYLPLFSFLWIKWINAKKIIWLFLFLTSSLFFSFAFSNPVFLLAIWTPALIFVLCNLWSERKSKKRFLYTLISSLTGVVLWALVNIWWLYPTLTLGSNWTNQTGQTWQIDFGSLQAVSRDFPLWEILLLRQGWYLGRANDWFDFYHNPLIYLLSLAVLFLVVLGFIKSKGFAYRKYLTILALVGLFISKGTNFPFGYIFFKFLFSNFSLTMALRNSYEKFGIVWLLPYAIFFAIGFGKLFNRFSYKRLMLGSLILVSSFGILVYPMWTGAIFPPEKHRLNIPNYYIEANEYLKKQTLTDRRIFHIPSLIEGGRLTYSWGFMGEDPSDNLFDLEVVSKPGTLGFDHVYRLMHKYLFEKTTPRLMGFLGIENMLLHKDNISPRININDTQQKLEQWEGVVNKKEFGKLIIYTFDKKFVKPRVYIATTIKVVPSVEEGIKGILNGSIDTSSGIFIVNKSLTVSNIQSTVKPEVKFKKLSSILYGVNIKNAKGPFILVLNNTFDKAWQLTIDKKPIEQHFIANDLVNGWVINKEGNFTAEIKLLVWPEFLSFL